MNRIDEILQSGAKFKEECIHDVLTAFGIDCDNLNEVRRRCELRSNPIDDETFVLIDGKRRCRIYSEVTRQSIAYHSEIKDFDEEEI